MFKFEENKRVCLMQTTQIQKLLDVNPEPVFIAERGSGRILYSNKAFGKKVTAALDLSSGNLFEAVPDSDKKNLNSFFEGQIHEGEFLFRSNDGRYIKRRLQADKFGKGSFIVTVKDEFDLWKTDFQGELIDKLNDAVISTDLSHEILFWNKAAERMYGWMESEVIGKKLDDILKIEMTESGRGKYLYDTEMQGVFYQVETGRHKNGSTVFTESRKISIHGSRGEVSGYVTVNRDITKRLKTLQELDKSEERYKKIFDENPLPIVIYREGDYSIVKANKAAERKYGYSVEEIEKLKITDFLPTEEIDRFKKISSRDFRDTRGGNFCTLGKSGRRVYIEYTSTRINYRGRSSRIVVINDITEKQKAEEKMRESSRKLQTIVSNLPMVLLEINAGGDIILAEGKAVENLGFKQGELIGKTAQDIAGDIELTQPNGESISVKDAIARIMRDEVITGHTETNGMYFDNYFVPVKKNGEHISGMLGVCLDITERVNFEKSFHSTEERFMLIAENTSELISMVSEGSYMYVSPSHQKLLGYSINELIEMGPLSLIHPDDKQSLKDWEEKGMKEFRVKNKEGSWLWLEGERFLLPGEPRITVGIARDITKRKIAEEALRESEERYRLMFERNPLPMFVRDDKTLKFLDVNLSAVKHYGYSKEELLNMTIRDIRPEEDIPALMNILASQDKGMNKFGTWRHRKKDGTIIDVNITTHGINYNGRPARLSMANDVTEKVKAEKALQESEEKYRRIVEYMDEGILMIDTEGKIIFANSKLIGLSGYPRHKLENQSILNFVYDEDKKKASEHLTKNRAGSIENFEFRLRHHDGSERLVSVSAVPVFNEARIYDGGLAFITDITRQREAEVKLQRTNEMLRALISYSPLGIIILDKDGKTELWNPACERMFGYGSEEVLGRKLPIVPEEKTEEHAALRKTIMDGNSFTGKEVSRRKKDGKKIEISLSASPLFDSDHHPIGISSFLMDVTDRRIAEKERNKLFKEVTSARNRLKILSSKLISVQEAEKRNISRELHDEIGQMLTAVKMDVQRMKDNTASKEIQVLADDCIRLVEETISVVRNLSLELRPSIIDDLGLEASLRWYTDKFFQRTGIEVKTEIKKVETILPPECAITLFRICQEALTNIAKHSEADYVKVRLDQKKNFINLSVEDNGKGFDLQKALRNAARGKSLGILGMQERSELAGGRFTVVSKEGEGTLIKATCQI